MNARRRRAPEPAAGEMYKNARFSIKMVIHLIEDELQEIVGLASGAGNIFVTET